MDMVRLDAKLSQMTTGWKSILLKPVDPFFHKHGAGTEVPFKITGTREEPHFGLDFQHKNEASPKKITHCSRGPQLPRADKRADANRKSIQHLGYCFRCSHRIFFEIEPQWMTLRFVAGTHKGGTGCGRTHCDSYTSTN